MKSKKCSKCGEVKPLHAYQRKQAAKDGLQYTCKECQREIRAEYYLNNKKNFAERSKKYREENKEKYVARSKKYYLENKDKLIAYQNKYKQENKKKVADRKGAYREKNLDKILMDGRNIAKEYSDTLHDSHIKTIISNVSNLKRKDIPQELIELKREQLKLHRAIKNY